MNEPKGTLHSKKINHLELIKKGVERLETEAELSELLKNSAIQGKPLRVKLGIDASAPDIHLGFAVVLRKLRQFQDLGHIAVLIVGDFTGKIGDPTGRTKTRRQLTPEEVQKNILNYQKQIFKILCPERCEFYYNSQWHDRLKSADIINIAAHYTLARLIEREDFKTRLQDGIPVFVHEILYPLFQGYDSIMVKADIELGGADQYWNLLVGRELQNRFGQKPQVVITVPLLVGTDGKLKMSKTYGNYIGITEPPGEMFGKLMSIPDKVILDYFRLATDKSEDEIVEIEKRLKAGENPRHIKAELAETIVAMYHNPGIARAAKEEFDRVFKEKKTPAAIPEFSLPPKGINIIDLIVTGGLLPSKSEARRKLQEGAVYIDGNRITDLNLIVKPGTSPLVLKVGKRRFLRLV